METINCIIMLIYMAPVLGLIAFLVGFKITGMKGRSYLTLNANEKVDGSTVIEILNKYKPYIYQDNCLKLDIKFIFYEFICQEDKMILIYRPVWTDEIHPNPLVHNLYKFFRWIFYGSIKDIEFIEIVIDRKTGDILSFSFETLAESASIEMPKHCFTEIIKRGKKFYNITKNNEITKVPFEDFHCILQVKTWNHLLYIEENPKGQKFDCILKPLTNWLYRKYAIARRSSGRYKTKQNKYVKYLVSILLMIIFGIGFPIVLYFVLC
ncbi:MAG: hypothetical protein K9W42_12430 [Candidatus Heimdallarchaeota archaeon]|nr:hypothetical protein [Candidatus Heimdallarchaeota archaeon]